MCSLDIVSKVGYLFYLQLATLYFTSVGEGGAQWDAGQSGTNSFIEKVGNSERSPFADRLVAKQPLHFCFHFAF